MRFEPRGLLAIAPSAIGQDFELPEAPASNVVDGVALEFIRGPIYQHPNAATDSYASIVARVSAALAGPAKAVVLVLDSPGGLVSGLFDAVRSLQAAAGSASKPLIAYVDGQACSAAYALACAASRIYVSDTADVGSIGVIAVLLDATASDEQAGLRFELVTSGARKSDGNPHSKISDAARANTQANVDFLAAKFFALVASARPLSASSVKALEAGTFIGELAVNARLADRVASLPEVLAATIAGRELDGVLTPEAAEALRAADAQPKPQQLSRAAARRLQAATQQAQWEAQRLAWQAQRAADPRGTAIQLCKRNGVEPTEENIDRHMPVGLRKIDGYRAPAAQPAWHRVSPPERPIDFSAIGAPVARRS